MPAWAKQLAKDAKAWGTQGLPHWPPKELLCALDGSPPSQTARDWALEWAEAYHGRLTFVSVHDASNHHGAAFDESEPDAKTVLAKAMEAAKGATCPTRALSVDGRPGLVLGDLPEHHGIHLMVLGSHGHSATRTGIGSQVRNRAACHTFVAKQPFSDGPVVVGYDGSRNALTAVMVAGEVAWRAGLKLAVVHAHPGGKGSAGPLGLGTTQYVDARGSPKDVLVGYARDHGASMIVVGARGQRRIPGWELGSVSDRVCQHATANVLVVRSD